MSRNTVFLGTISAQKPGDGEGSGGGTRNVSSVQQPPLVTVDYETPLIDVPLPASVTVTLEDNSTAQLFVINWLGALYDAEVPGDYVFTGELVLVTGITNSTNIVPTVTVRVRQDFAYDVYVETVGNGGDDGNTGTAPDSPLLTLEAGVVLAESLGGPRVIKMGVGEFIINSYIELPVNISIVGAGFQSTTIKGHSSLNYDGTIPLFQWGFDKALIQAVSLTPTDGNQFIRDLYLDGETKSKHGGIYVKNRNNFTLRDMGLTQFGMWGVWAIDVDDFEIINVLIQDSADSATNASTGGLMFGNNTNTKIDGLNVNGDVGYGVKIFGPAPIKPIVTNFRMANSTVSVDPDSAFGTGDIANITVEFHECFVINCEIVNCTFDNVFSFVTDITQTSSYQSGAETLNFHGNRCDLWVRANNSKGYPLELSAHNVRVYDCDFVGGQHGAIANFNSTGGAKNNWLIFNNVFRLQEGLLPVGIIRSTITALTNLQFYNNTIDITNGTFPHTVNIVQTDSGQISSNWTLRNNVINDRSTVDAQPANGGPNSFIKLDGGGVVTNLLVTHNCVFGMPIGSIPNGVYTNNLTVDPQLTLVGAAPDPFYRPLPASPLLNAGINVGVPFTGSVPTIGRYELQNLSTEPIEELEILADIIVPTGTAFGTNGAGIGLPQTIEATLVDTSIEDIAITWSIGSYDQDVADIYNITGTLVLPIGITNPLGLFPTVSVIVGTRIILFEDSFDRVATTPGSNYTVEGTMTFDLDGSGMEIDGADGQLNQRLLVNTSFEGLFNFRVKMLAVIEELSSTSYGLGLGIQNTINPDPNKGVFLTFHMSTNPDSGLLRILSGDGTTSTAGFIERAIATTQIPITLGQTYEFEFVREVDGSDLIFTAIVTNIHTQSSNTTSWREVGAGSILYEATSKVVIHRFGGLQRISFLEIEDLTNESPFPNIVSVNAVSPITVANGTQFGSVGLPASVQVTLSDASTPTYAVTWAPGTYSPTTAGAYSVVGTLTVPSLVTNTGNLKAGAVVTVNAPSSAFIFDYYVAGPGATGAVGNDSTGTGDIGAPWATIQRAVNTAMPGETIGVRGGTGGAVVDYRETITLPRSGTNGNPITIARYPGERARVSGLEIMSAGGWTNDGGQVYRKTFTLPVNGLNTDTNFETYPTKIFANQIFRDGVMMMQSRWPKADSVDDLFDRSSKRGAVNYLNGFNLTTLTDGGLPLAAPGLIGATMYSEGWFHSDTRTITGHSGNTISWVGNLWDNDANRRAMRQRYFLTNLRALLTAEGEWHYSGGTFYFWQPGGGSPTGTIEYKARNYGFDGRGRSYITIAGLEFIGCEPYIGDANSGNAIIDNIRASYQNHHIRHDRSEWQGVGMCKMFGIKLFGPNSIIKNSELHSCASQSVWAGPNCQVYNCYFHHIGYAGNWAAPVTPWDNDDGMKVLWCTMHDTGRSCVDLGYNFGTAAAPVRRLNMEIGYNNFYRYMRVSADGGATYAWGQADFSGGRIHHNWYHHNMTPWEQVSPGTNSGIYFDQATGPMTIDHNVVWKTTDNDMYHEVTNADWRNTNLYPPLPVMNIYNNTFATVEAAQGHMGSYTTYVPSPTDIQRNNIYRRRVVINWQTGHPTTRANITNSHFFTTAHYSGSDAQFVGGFDENDGRQFQLQVTSPARNIGVVIPGITDGYLGVAPDAGAYEQGVTPWVPGYVAVPYEEPDIPPPPTEVDIVSIDTVVSDFDVAYRTPFGTNGAGVALPQTINVTFDDASTDTIGVTWAIGTYNSGAQGSTVGVYTDVSYNIVGTPVLTGDMTNTGGLTINVDITVKDMFHPIVSPIALILDGTQLVTNTTNSFGTVDVSGGTTSVLSQSPGPTGRDFINSGTAPTLSGNRIVFNGTGALAEAVDSGLFDFMHYNATAANVKWSVFAGVNPTDTGTNYGLIGNNGFGGIDGFCTTINTEGTKRGIATKITANGVSAWNAYNDNFLTLGAEQIITTQVDNALAGASGKFKHLTNLTVTTNTVTGAGVLDNSPAPGHLQIGAAGANLLRMTGTLSMIVILEGVESDAVRNKLIEDIAFYTGVTI